MVEDVFDLVVMVSDGMEMVSMGGDWGDLVDARVEVVCFPNVWEIDLIDGMGERSSGRAVKVLLSHWTTYIHLEVV